MPFGVLLLAVTPPFQAPDEWEHFFRAFQVSELGFRAERAEGTSGGYLPIGLVAFARRPAWGRLPFHPDATVTAGTFAPEPSRRLRRRQRTFVAFRNAAEYSPIAYVPQALGIRLGTALSLPPIAVFYLARLTNLLCATVVIGATIRRVPLLPWTMALLALTPMCVFQTASCSIDATTIALAFAFVGMALQLAFGNARPPTTVDWVWLGVVAGLLLVTKPYLAMLLLPLVLVPAARMGSARVAAVRMTIYLALGTLPFILWRVLNGGVDVALPNGAAPGPQLAGMLNDPVRFLTVFLHTIAVAWTTYLWQFVGILGWLDTPLPGIVVAGYLVLLAGTALLETNPAVVLRVWQRLALLAIVAATVAMLHVLLYLYFTQVGKPYIDGVQGRYFLPVAPILLLALHNRRFSLDVGRYAGRLMLASAVTLTSAVIAIVDRYYIAP